MKILSCFACAVVIGGLAHFASTMGMPDFTLIAATVAGLVGLVLGK